MKASTNLFYSSVLPEPEEKLLCATFFNQLPRLGDSVINAFFTQNTKGEELSEILLFIDKSGSFDELMMATNSIFTSLYRRNQIEIEKFLDPKLEYFKNNKQSYLDKLTTMTF